jgi:hypothetical protein
MVPERMVSQSIKMGNSLEFNKALTVFQRGTPKLATWRATALIQFKGDGTRRTNASLSCVFAS